MTSRNQIQRIKKLEEQIARMPTYDFIELEWDGEPWIIPVPRQTLEQLEETNRILKAYCREETEDAKE